MAQSTTKPAKKKATKTVARKKRTLLIPDLPDASVVAIDRAKGEFGVGHTTRAAQRMMESYWQKSDDLRRARDRVRQLEMQLERIASYYEEISSAKKGIKDILAEH